jgi:hypothetical protein
MGEILKNLVFWLYLLTIVRLLGWSRYHDRQN